MKKLILSLAVLSLFGGGCISFGGGPTGSDGGIFKSVDRGEAWQHKVAVPTSEGVASFAGTNIESFAIDPQDHNAIYVGTRESGILYSYDGGDSWHRPAGFASGFVADVAVSPNSKCTIYAATGHRVVRSTDCNRTYKEIYREPSQQTFITALTINQFNPSHIYLGTVKGTLIKSKDAGRTWSLEHTFPKGRILDIVVDPRNSAVRYVSLKGKGVWKTTNDGVSFTDLSEGLREFRYGLEVKQLVADKATPNGLLLAAKHKILRSRDGAVTWEELPIVTPDTVAILTLAVSPKNSSHIYYGTATTFYRSKDGGQSWSTKKLPSSRAASVLVVDFEEPDNIYLGVAKLQQ